MRALIACNTFASLVNFTTPKNTTMKHARNIRLLTGTVVLLLATLGIVPAANASLIGAEVIVSFIEVNAPASPTVHFTDTVTVVEPGPEADVAGAFIVDIGAETIRLDLYGGGALPAADFLGFIFEDLFLSPVPGEIVGFSAAATNIAGVDNSRLLFDAHTVALNLQGLTLEAGNFLEVTLDVVHAVPAPSVLLMFLTGAGLLTWRHRAHS